MYNYLVGTLFFTAFIIFLYLLGNAILDNRKSAPYKLLTGYLVYSFFVAIGGITVQVLNTEWIIFFWYMIVILLLFLIFIAYKSLKNREFSLSLTDYFKNNFFLYVIPSILVFLLLFCFVALWFNNHLDDGFYIGKIATYPYVTEPFSRNPSTGFLYDFKIDSYTFNTHELEASFYVYLLQISVTVYTRFFLSWFHYFLLANCVYVIAEIVFSSFSISYSKTILQFVPIIIILFSFNELFLQETGIITLQDSNQFTNAMYYGSSVVRTMGILLLIYPFLEDLKLDYKVVLKVMAISIVLLSKSSIAVPVVFYSAVAYVFTYFLFNKRNLGIALLISFLIINFIIYFVIGSTYITQYGLGNIKNNSTSIVLIISFILYCLSFLFRDKKINQINCFLALIFLFSFFPVLNSSTEYLAIYPFVLGRFFTCFSYTFIIFTFIYFIIPLLKNFKSSMVTLLNSVLCCFLSVGALYSIRERGGVLYPVDYKSTLDLTNAFNIMINNPQLVPNSTIHLGKTLTRLSSETNENLYVIMEHLVNVNGTAHSLDIIIRSFCPEIYVVSALTRYVHGNQDSIYYEYDELEHAKFTNYTLKNDLETFNDFLTLIDKYSVNCVILYSTSYDYFMNQAGFFVYDQVIDESAGVSYYVYYKE